MLNTPLRHLAPILCTLSLTASGAFAQVPVPEIPTETPPIPADTVVVTTDSGLSYSVLAQGNGGNSPVYGDRVKVHYTGWLVDGTLFDSSRQRNQPAEFAVGRVIDGWNEALGLMTPGSRFKLTIPAALAYGEEGRPGIPANSTLIFDVELLAITARTMAYVPWDAAAVQTLDSGLEYVPIHNGSGQACAEADAVMIEFAMYDEAGKPVLSSAMEGAPLLGDPKKLPLEFLTELMANAHQGTHVNILVPSEKMSRLKGMPGVVEGQSYLWQVKIISAMAFKKPEFVLPPDEELTTTASGLKYKVIREGSGAHPTAANSVVAHYAGWTIEGTPFDNSYDRGEPSTFPLTRVIAGWTEGLQLMQPGSMVLFVIPSELGYGENGSPPVIKPGATLVFVVELVDVR